VIPVQHEGSPPPPGPPDQTATAALLAARQRLAALDGTPVEQHPAVFAAVHELLTSALGVTSAG
jgi:hypothetical protein